MCLKMPPPLIIKHFCENNQPILIIFVYTMLMKLDIGKKNRNMLTSHTSYCRTALGNTKSDFQLCSTIISIKQLIFLNHFHSVHHINTVNYRTLLAYVIMWVYKMTSICHSCSCKVFFWKISWLIKITVAYCQKHFLHFPWQYGNSLYVRWASW